MTTRRALAIAVAAALGGALATSSCGADPCAVLEQESCGSDDSCAGEETCVRAREMARRGVTEACEAARQNGVSFPDCRS